MGVGSGFTGCLSAASTDLTVGGGVLSDGFSKGPVGSDDGGISDGGGGGSSYCRVVQIHTHIFLPSNADNKFSFLYNF